MDDSQIYIHSNYMQKKDIIEVLEEHGNNFEWHGEERILDIDCGLGDITESILFPIMPKYSALVGSDVSEEMIDYCNKFRKKERLSFRVLDIQHLDLSFEWELESFDKIFSFYCLRWIQNYSRAVCNMYSLLKYNGIILLLLLTPDNPINLAFQLLKTSPKWNRYLTNIRWFYEAEDPVNFIQMLLCDVGFRDIYCYLKLSSTHYPSWDAYMELIKAVNPYLRYIPEELKSECLLLIKEALKLQNHVVENPATGAVTVHYNLVIAIAKKI